MKPLSANALRRGPRERSPKAMRSPRTLVALHPHLPRRLTALLGLGASVTLVCALAAPAQAAAGNQSPPTGTASSALVTDPASLVNPFIGTTNRATTSPAPTLPFGMVQWSPDTTSRPPGGGYEYNDSAITGFSLTHLSGPGCGAQGDIPILPTTGSINTSATDSFSHANESADAGDYKVALANGVTTELTATTAHRDGGLHVPLHHPGQPAAQAERRGQRHDAGPASTWSATPRCRGTPRPAASAAPTPPTGPCTSTCSSASPSPAARAARSRR